MTDALLVSEDTWAKPKPARPALKPAAGRCYTYADYEKWNDDIRREIIGGEVYEMAAPSWWHQLISAELLRQFGNYLQGKKCKVVAAPVDVRLFAPVEGPDNKKDRDVVQPDLVVVCDPKKPYRKGVRGAPELVVEILSESNRSHDTLLKFNKYMKAGVREYWIVNPEDKILTVHTLVEHPDGNAYTTKAYEASARVKVGVLDDCVIDMAAVFTAGEEDGQFDG